MQRETKAKPLPRPRAGRPIAGSSRPLTPCASEPLYARCAFVSSMASSLTEDLVCPICLAIFQEPHLLSCGHNFCLACLQSCVPEGEEGATCPECRLPFELRELKRNRALANVARKVRRLRLDQEPLLEAAGLENFCEEHDEPLKLFCSQDRVLICVICRDLPQHRGHEFLPTKHAVRYAQGKLKPYQKLLEKNLKFVTSNESLQEKKIASLERYTEDTLGDISKGFEVLHQTLHEKEQNFKKIVLEKKEENMKDMKAALTSLKEKKALHTENLSKIKAALVTTDHIAFLKDFKDLMDKVKKYPLEEDEYDESSGEEEEEEEEEEAASDWSSDQEETIENEEACQTESEEEYDEEEGKEGEAKVVPVDPALEEFRDSLNFEAWKEMLEQIKSWQKNQKEGETLDESASRKEEETGNGEIVLGVLDIYPKSPVRFQVHGSKSRDKFLECLQDNLCQGSSLGSNVNKKKGGGAWMGHELSREQTRLEGSLQLWKNKKTLQAETASHSAMAGKDTFSYLVKNKRQSYN